MVESARGVLVSPLASGLGILALLVGALTACSDSGEGTTDAAPGADQGPCSTANCSGCCEGEACRSGQSPAACGTAGLTCVRCDPDDDCTAAGNCQPRSSACSPANCGGCCAGDRCEPGDGDEACGRGGALCQRCSSTQRCGEGACRCDTKTCSGCCSDGRCQSGDLDEACGRGGASCEACPPGKLCRGGACVDDEGCGRCNGCCDGALCRPGTGEPHCGRGGAPCRACQGGESCSQGICNDPSKCGAGTCNGCCKDSLCLGGDEDGACGLAGGLCLPCGPADRCIDHACVVDPDSSWSITVVEAEIDSSLGAWDTLFNTAPDPYVEVEIGSVETKTTVIDDTYEPKWNELIAVVSAKEILALGLEVTVRDSDAFGSEIVGACLIAVSAQVLRGGIGLVESCPRPDDDQPFIKSLVLSFAVQ